MTTNFPELTRKPILTGYTEEPIVDLTVRTIFSNGSIKTRGSSTKTPKKYTLVFPFITIAEKNTLQTFELSVNYGQDTFIFVQPTNNDSINVKFNKPIVFEQTQKEDFYNVQIEFVEVLS